MRKAAVISAATVIGALASTGAEAQWRSYGYGPSTTTYTYSETRYGDGYRDVGYYGDPEPAYRTRRVVREVYEAGPRYPGYSWGGPQYRGADLDDDE